MAEMINNQRLKDKLDGDLEEAKKDLATWETKVEKADDAKSRLIMEKVEEDKAKDKAKLEMLTWVKNRNDCKMEINKHMSVVQDEISKLAKNKQDLLAKLRRCQSKLDDKKKQSTQLKQKFKINAQIPDTEVKFSTQHSEECDDDSELIRGVFTISQRAPVLLQGGQALITFEEEKVASQILKIAKCAISCENTTLDVKPKRIVVDPAVKFEVRLDVSRKKLKISNVPPSMPEERIKDRLEMSFSRPSRGGGEVEDVEYDKNTGTGLITFLHRGVAECLALTGKYRVDLDSEVNVHLGAVYKYDLHKFQTFCGTVKRTILLYDIMDIEDEEDLQDHLEIHFQKPSNCGGEIENIKYVSGPNCLQAYFSEDTVERDH